MIRVSASNGERGVALPLALFTLVIAAVMITAVFWVARMEQRMGYNSIASTQAFEAAETGVVQVLTTWDKATYNVLTTGGTYSTPTATYGGNATYTTTVRRLNTNLFLLQAEGRYLVAGQAVTRRQVARVVRLDPPPLNPVNPITSRVGPQLSGNTSVNGFDNTPLYWTGPGVCPPPGGAVSAVRDSSGSVNSGGCSVGDCMTGASPDVQQDVSLGVNAFTQFGSETFASLAAGADKVIAPSRDLGGLGATFTVTGDCKTTDEQNWGDASNPSSECGSYFPLIYAQGDLTISGGNGQGILLVEGDLRINNSVKFYGIVLVQGRVIATDGTIYGALMVKNGSGPSSLGGTTEINYSRCAIDRAGGGASLPNPLRDRSWVQLY